MILKVTSPSHSPQLFEIENEESFSIGRSNENRIVLASRFIPDDVALASVLDGLLFIKPTAQSVSLLRNGQKLDLNIEHEITRQCKVEIGPFTLTIASEEAAADTPRQRMEKLNDEMATLIKSVHALLCERNPILRENNEKNSHVVARDKALMNELDQAIEKAAFEDEVVHEEAGIRLHARRDLQMHMAGQCVSQRLIDFVFGANIQSTENVLSHLYESQTVPQFEHDLARCVEEAISFLELNDKDENEETLDKKMLISQRAAKVDTLFHTYWSQSVYSKNADFVAYLTKREIKKQIKDIVFGYGPLEDLLLSLIHISEPTRPY